MSELIILPSIEQRINEIDMPAGKRKTLIAATQLFAKHGFNGTSTSRLAELAGVSQATIFKYFKTKEDILFAVLEPVAEIIGTDFVSGLSKMSTKEEFVHYFVRDRYYFVKSNIDIIKIILQELLTNTNIKKFFKEQVSRNMYMIIEIFKPLIDKDDLSFEYIVRSFISPLSTLILQEILFDVVLDDGDVDLALEMVEKQILEFLNEG